MTTPVWQPGTLYSPGALVRPVSSQPTTQSPVTNGNFEAGDTGWTFDPANFEIGEFGSGKHFDGTWSLKFDPPVQALTDRCINDNAVSVVPGQTINASCQVNQGASSAGDAGARAEVAWYDASDDLISFSSGNLVTSSPGFKNSSVAAVAPAGAAFARFSVYAFRTNGGNPLYVDTCVWDAIPSQFSAGLIFKAVQAIAGFSGASEPVWPLVNGQQVVDNQVTWEAVYASRVVWEASPILVSGSTEPVWPTVVNGTVADNTIKWVALDTRVQDPKAPQSKIVAIGASKIFAADGDIIPFSATVNPLDWSTEQDAGYLPFGLQTHGSTPVTAMGLYRSNLVAFNDQGYQMWQIDEDPANMALLDASPVDCPYRKSVKPVANDLVFLSALGIRNIGIAGASTNIQAGFFGKQVDPLVLEKVRAGEFPNSLFWPGAGQYWLFFGEEAFVLTINGGVKDMSWSRYVFPEAITDWAILDTALFLRAGDIVWEVSDEVCGADDAPTTGLLATEDGTLIVTENGAPLLVFESGGTPIPFEGYLAWPYLDFGQLGVDKMLEGFNVVCDGEVTITIGYDQTNFALATPGFTVSGDTLPGNMVPMPVTGRSLQFRLTFSSEQCWEWEASALYLSDTLLPA